MNRLFIFLFLFFGLTTTKAQIHEIGVFLGGSNYIGEIGKTDYIAPNQAAFGILYKWNKSPRHSWRFSYTMSKIISDDKNATDPARKQRGYEFENSIKEVAAGLEFNFFDFNLHDSKPKLTPYVYSGLSYTRYDGLYFVNGKAEIDETHGTLAIPMILGIKTRLAGHLILGLEAGARYSFKDDLDGSNPTNTNLENLKFGNINSKDWYVFTGFTLTYTFGNKPCYCAD
ncbi:type IX secretion system protein PorG [Flavobacterium psychrotolerans]|uniref:DUF6089 domain-containing protein n=1 Tax=Flavobacterium psychrotolerans TaxID=2169410 RepID=A0A2U1JNS8_9FLAO|nr:DUF6089 family protein [Flavobacterium psychrotolerans]PWA06782.1 hypothetical protein DB895_02005 [Flavobacterium psychrotolerans]